MGKALMVSGPDGAVNNGDEHPFQGGGGQNTGDTDASIEATEGLTLSTSGVQIASGNSGSMTFRSRINGANGNLAMTRSGAGGADDLVDSDVLSASDIFNWAYTDTGTASNMAWIKACVALASGHGNIHAVTGITGRVFDVPSATVYAALGGNLIDDGTATVANAQWKTYAYDSVEAIQARVSANARTNTSTISLNVNGSDVGTPISITSGATGLFTVTGMAEALSPGDLVCASVTLSTGTEDLTLLSIGVTMKSTAQKSETFCCLTGGVARSASATPSRYPIGAQAFDGGFTEAVQAIPPGFKAIVSQLRCYVAANTNSSDVTLTVYKNGVSAATVTISAAATGWQENLVSAFSISATDTLSFELVGGTSGSMTFTYIGVTFSPIPAPQGNGWMWAG